MILAWDVCDRVPRLAWRTATAAGVLEFPGEKPTTVLLHAIDQLRQTHGEIQKLAVLRGPGSFTGIRTGLATAQGLMIALQVPCFGFTKFEILARELPAATGLLVLAGPRASVFAHPIEAGKLIGEPDQRQFGDVDTAQGLYSDRDIEGLNTRVVAVDYAQGCAKLAAEHTDAAGFSLEPLYIRSADTVVGKPLIQKLLEGEGA